MTYDLIISRRCFGVLAITCFLLLALTNFVLAEDLVGVYFDDSYLSNSIEATDGDLVTGFIVLEDPSAAEGVAGWELCVGLAGPGIIMNWDLQGENINVLSPPCFMVGTGSPPLPGTDRVLLASFGLYVQGPLPIIISLEPVTPASIPGHMAYLSHPDPHDIIPMTTVTGMPEVAWVNQYAAGVEVAPALMDFGVVIVGTTATENVTVRNTGGVPLFLDIAISEGCEYFSLVDVMGPQTVPVGAQLEIPVSFNPNSHEQIECLLHLGTPHAADVPLVGSGRAAILSWEIDSPVDFQEVLVGQTVVQNIGVRNTGEVTFSFEPQILGACPSFNYLGNASYTLTPGSNTYMAVAFSPVGMGAVICDLGMGATLPSVLLLGTGIEEEFGEYSLSVDMLNFPETIATTFSDLTVEISNTGGMPLFFDVYLENSSGFYSIIFGGGPHIVQPGDNLSVGVRFAPTQSGVWTNTLNFDPWGLSVIPVSGQCIGQLLSCQLSSNLFDFGEVELGFSAARVLTVSNGGNTDMLLAPVGECDQIQVYPESAIIVPGESKQFNMIFTPDAFGPWDCVVSLGESHCSPINCFGYVDGEAPSDENLVGLFFDESFTQMESDIDPSLVHTVHLVLINQTYGDGLWGWECTLGVEGAKASPLATNFPNSVYNYADEFDYYVRFYEPTPLTPTVLLATIQVLLSAPEETISLHLLPKYGASIAGEMAYFTGPYFYGPRPMRPHTGESTVAVIYNNSVATYAPAPSVALTGGSVDLSWQVPENTTHQYLVMRRAEDGIAGALFEDPQSAVSGTFTYRDDPTGYPDGTVMFYSYSIIQDGLEVGRSPETSIELSGMPVLSTRLLGNVPNPFNPMTEVNFEMEKAAMVRVSVYDISGRLVKTLVHEHVEAGPHSRLWEGKDLAGRQVPSGSYYLRLETSERTDHRKMLLLK